MKLRNTNWKILFCIDETSVKSLQKHQKHNHCYNEIGKRCVIKTQSQEVFKKYRGIFAISNGNKWSNMQTVHI
jgi:hypothetical protein